MILKMINLNHSKEGELQVINCVIHCCINPTRIGLNICEVSNPQEIRLIWRVEGVNNSYAFIVMSLHFLFGGFKRQVQQYKNQP